MCAVGGVQRAVAEAMVGPFECDNPGFAGGEERSFQRGFDCFEAGVGENCFTIASSPALESDAAEFAREFGLARVRMNIAHGVKQFGHLLRGGAEDVAIRMTGSGHSERRV